MANELKDHERAHSGQPGAKVRHGQDATGKVNPQATYNKFLEAKGFKPVPHNEDD